MYHDRLVCRYRVKWVGFKEPTWQAYETLPPVVIKEYRESLEETKEKYEEVPPPPPSPSRRLMTNRKNHTHTQITLEARTHTHT